MSETERQFSDTQHGVSTGGNAAWDTPFLLGLAAPTTERMGFRFSTLPFDSVGDVPRPMFQTALIFRTVTLRLPIGAILVTGGTLTVRYVDERNPALFGAGRVPGSGALDEIVVGTASYVLGQTGNVDVVLDMAALHGQFGNDVVADFRYNQEGFQGVLAFTVSLASSGASTFIMGNLAVLVANAVPFHSGVAGITPVGGRGAIDEKTGQITTDEHLVTDGYTSLRVLPENYDEPEPPKRVRRPSPRRYEVPR